MASYIKTNYIQSVSAVPGYEMTTDTQEFGTPIYDEDTLITVPYSGGTPTLDSTFKVSVTSGDNPRELSSAGETPDFKVEVVDATSFLVTISADVLDEDDLEDENHVTLEFDYKVTLS